MKEKVFRHELKYYINMSDYLSIKNRLKYILKADSNAGEKGYKIRSLYFDNYRDKALMEKIEGLNNREKFRIRFYNNDPSFIKLEKKSKINGLCSKESEIITKEECEKIIEGNYDFLKESKKPLFIELYSKMKGDLLRPKTIVDYERDAYIYPIGNVRITFDKNIRTGIASKNMFDGNLPTVAAAEKEIIILEIKYDEFLPEVIQNVVQINNRMSSAFSKYAACRIYG